MSRTVCNWPSVCLELCVIGLLYGELCQKCQRICKHILFFCNTQRQPRKKIKRAYKPTHVTELTCVNLPRQTCTSEKKARTANIKYAIWPIIASFIILVRNENRSWQKHFTAEENYFLFVFATCNFIIILTKAATSPIWPLCGILRRP